MNDFNWQLREYSFSEEPPKPMPELIWKLLSSRGIQTLDEVETLFSPKLSALSNPLSLDGMEAAVHRILEAFEKKQKICIYADFDLDGTSGLALLLQAFKELGFEDLIYYQPKRLSEGYGVHSYVMDHLSQQNVNLIVTVDVGITAFEAAQRVQDLGMDLIITDHHLPKENLPEAVAIVNPNKGTCPSQLGHLCGAGVGFYLALAVRAALKEKGLLKKDVNPKDWLDCFVIGTLTDLVPLVGENRVLVKHGLLQLENTKRPGLKALLEELNLSGRPLTSSDVAIRFAPKLNALSRMEMGILPLDIFLAKSNEEAEELVSVVMKNNALRLELQQQAELEASEFVRNNPQSGFIFSYSANFHKGVVGLVATKLAQKHGVPAFVGSLSEDQKIVGSGRVPPDSELSLLDALDSAQSSLKQYGGHAPAAGFELSQNQANDFEMKLTQYYESQNNEPQVSSVVYDAEAELSEIHSSFMNWYNQMGPYGNQFEIPLIRVKNMQISSLRLLRGGHWKFDVKSSQTYHRMGAIWFSPPSNHPLIQNALEIGEDVEAIVEPQWNYYNGQQTLQLLIKDIQRVL